MQKTLYFGSLVFLLIFQMLILMLHIQDHCVFFTGKYQQKQPTRGVLRKTGSEHMQEIYRGTPMLKCDSFATLLKSQFGMGVFL